MRTLRRFLLFLLAVGLFIIMIPCLLIEVSYRIYHGTLGDYFKRIAYSIDQTGNATYPVTFTLLFIRWRDGDWYKFGNPDEAISGVKGKNRRLGNESKLGVKFGNFLNRLDPDHLEKAIEEDENFTP